MNYGRIIYFNLEYLIILNKKIKNRFLMMNFHLKSIFDFFIQYY